MKRCQNCGAEAKDHAKFCTLCGTPFAQEAATPATESMRETADAPVERVPEAPAPSEIAEQEPTMEQAQPPQVQQPPVPGEPVAPTYGDAPPAHQQQGQPPVPPTYGYAQQTPPSQARQPMAPPTYGYAQQTPPSQARQPMAPPTYGYAQQPQSRQALPEQNYPYQEPKETKPKKKRRWVIPVIAIGVVLALLVGAYFVFADQIKGLFSSPEKKWLNAEKSLLTVNEDSIFGPFQKSLNKQRALTKFGGEMAISIDVEGNTDPEAAAILDIISKLRLSVGSKVEIDKDDLRLHTTLGLGNREKEEDALTLQVYSVDGNFVIDASPILQKPLVLRAEALQEMINTDDEFSALFGSGSTKFANAMKNIANILSSPEKICGDLLDIIAKHAEKPEVKKGTEFTVNGISQKLDKYTVVVKAEKTPEMFKDILTYVRDNEDIRKVVVELAAISEMFDPPMPGKVYSNAFTYEDFVASINDSIEDVEDNPDKYRGEFERELYLDNKGKPRGGKLTIWNVKDGDKEQALTFEDVHVESGGKHAYKLVVQPEDEEGLIFTSEYTLKDKRYTGNFELQTSYEGKERTFLSGSVDSFGFVEAEGQVYPVGKFVLDASAVDGEMPSDISMPNAIITYDGKLEKKSDGSHLAATVEFAVSGSDISFSSIKLSLDFRALPEKDVKFETKMPTDFVDLMDEEALAALVENDPGIMLRLMQVMSELGIDISQFMFD